MAKFRKKPVIIEAVQWTGDNHNEIHAIEKGSIREVYFVSNDKSLIIPTLEGDHKAIVGDYIIRGIKGELYPCKPDIFEETYDPVDE